MDNKLKIQYRNMGKVHPLLLLLAPLLRSRVFTTSSKNQLFLMSQRAPMAQVCENTPLKRPLFRGLVFAPFQMRGWSNEASV